MAEYTSPESRFRMPSLFSSIGKKMGEMLLSGEPSKDPYGLFQHWIDKPYIESAETQLTKSLFGMENEVAPSSVFDMIEENGSKVFNISKGELGQKYQDRLNMHFDRMFSIFADEHDRLLAEGDKEGAKDVLARAKEKMMAVNPDTGKPSYKFREGILGDVYLNPKGEFNDYWNIGLDKGEKLTSIANLKRMFAAPFTKPPTVRGSVKLDESTRRFFESLFPNGIEDNIVDNMLASEQDIFK